MARSGPLFWAFSLLFVSANLADAIGVNWGSMASHPLNPSIVVGMLKDNGFDKVKLFDADSWTVSALAGTGIEAMVAIPNNQLKAMNNYRNAQSWVKENVTKHIYEGGVKIKYAAVGNEPFLTSYNGSFEKTTFPALQNIQRALNEAGHGDKIKAVVPLNADVYDSGSGKPSDGDFRRDIKDLMVKIVKFLQSNDAPFVVNIYPFLSLYANPDFPIDFAFFEGGAKPVIDKNFQYTNVFDANYDTLVSTLKRAGTPDLKIIVGEVGWPTEGDRSANKKLAKRFYDGFFRKMGSKKGTPLRPGPLEVYLFGLLDEDMKSIAPGDFERHWGIFQYDGQPKFAIDMSGKGQEKLPVGGKGVQYLTNRWCVFNGNAKNKSQISSNIQYACSLGDCTSLGYGSSCNNLGAEGNISYAFNMYFQMQDQDVQACDFDGLAKLTTVNASKGECLFPVQVMSSAERLKLVSGALTAVAGFLMILFVLL